MAKMQISIADSERLIKALKDYPKNAEEAVNEVLHGEAGILISEEIKRLMPVSGRQWAGKRPAAKFANSLTQEDGNLSVTEKTTSAYHYLYFPDDGTNTRRHVGNQQFFMRGAENKQPEIIDRCVARLVEDFGK